MRMILPLEAIEEIVVGVGAEVEVEVATIEVIGNIVR